MGPVVAGEARVPGEPTTPVARSGQPWSRRRRRGSVGPGSRRGASAWRRRVAVRSGSRQSRTPHRGPARGSPGRHPLRLRCRVRSDDRRGSAHGGRRPASPQSAGPDRRQTISWGDGRASPMRNRFTDGPRTSRHSVRAVRDHRAFDWIIRSRRQAANRRTAVEHVGRRVSAGHV